MSRPVDSGWCSVCATRHDLGPTCPGELAADGPEQVSGHVSVLTETGREIYCVLIAESGEFWRARIMTAPNMLWCVPNGRQPLRIVARSATEVEMAARQLITEHCAKRRLTMTEDEAPGWLKSGLEEIEAAAHQPRGSRHPQTLAVRFGEEEADRQGSTTNISKRGMFVLTRHPLPEGRRVRLVLELPDCKIPLSGTVIWVRLRPSEDRPTGMGVQLSATPALYQHYVRELNPEGAQADTISEP